MSTDHSLSHADKSGALAKSLPTGHKIALESGGFLFGEAVQATVGIGVVAIADMLIPKPILKSASEAVAHMVIEPFLDPIERGLKRICKLKECTTDESKSREERSEALARTLIIFGAAYAIGMVAKLHTRRAWNKHFNIMTDDKIILPPANAGFLEKVKHYGLLKHWTPQEKLIFAMDEGVHLGSLYLVNNTLAPYTDQAIRTTSSMLQKVTGCSEQKAKEISSMAWIWEAANGLGALAGIGVIAGNHSFNLSRRIAGLFSNTTKHPL